MVTFSGGKISEVSEIPESQNISCQVGFEMEALIKLKLAHRFTRESGE